MFGTVGAVGSTGYGYITELHAVTGLVQSATFVNVSHAG